MTFRIRVDTSDAMAGLRRYQTRTQPRAETKALNQTGAMARRKVMADIPRLFVTRNAWVKQGVRYEPAAMGEHKVVVYHRDKYMAKQEDGGIDKPLFKDNLTIPARVRTNRKRNIPKAKRPQALLDKEDYFQGYTRKGKHVIFKRPRNRNSELEVQYVLKRSATYRPRWGFERTVTEIHRRFFRRFYARALRRSL